MMIEDHDENTVVTFDSEMEKKENEQELTEELVSSEEQVVLDDTSIPAINFDDSIKSQDVSDPILKGMNPFQFKLDKNGLYTALSIEDFYTKYKGEDLTLRYIIRTSNLSKFKKRWITIRAIKGWISGYANAEDLSALLLRDEQIYKNIKIKKMGLGSYFLLLLCSIFLFVSYFGNGSLFGIEEPGFFERILIGLHNIVTIHKIGSFAAILGICLAIASWTIVIVSARAKKEYLKIVKKIRGVSSDIKNGQASSFSNKSKNTLKYYKKLFKNSDYVNVQPLPVEETMVNTFDMDRLKDYNGDLLKGAKILSRRKGILFFIKFLCFWTTYLATLFIVGYGIVQAFINL